MKDLQSALDKRDEHVATLKNQIDTSESRLQELKSKCDNQASEIIALKAHQDAASDVTSGPFTTVAKDAPKKDPPPPPTHQERGTASSPDAFVIGNSLTADLNPAQLFAPKFTKIQTLKNKNLDGALEYLDTEGIKDIKPKINIANKSTLIA